MELRQLRYFIEVVTHGSFTRTATALSLPQSVVSHHVAQLEKELMQPLFHRNGRGVVATEAGKILFDHAQAIMRQVAHAEHEVAALKGAPVGRITLALGPSIARCLLSQLIVQSAKLFPAAKLATYEGQTASIVDWLTIGRVDMGLVYSPPLSPTYRLKKIEDIELSLISKVGRHKPKSLRDTVSLHDVMKQPLVMLTKDHAVRRLLEQQARGTRLNVVYEVEDVSGVAATLDLVESGVGSTILPFHATFINGRNSRPGLISQKIVSPALTLPLYLALPNHRPITPLSKRVAKYLETFVPQTMSSLRQQCW